MQTETFFPGTQRRVTLGSPTKQCSNGRIVFPIQMPLTGESFVGMPDWIGTGYDAVSKSFTEVDPEVQSVSDLVLAFSNDKPTGELFAPPSAKVPGAELKGFKITRVGEPDDPEVELHFKAFAPFTRDFWAWIGEMAGKEVYMAFPSSLSGAVTVMKSEPLPLVEALDAVIDAKEKGTEGEFQNAEAAYIQTVTNLTDIPEDPTIEEALGPEFEAQVRQSLGAPEPFSDKPRLVDARPTKSGPRELKAFHEGLNASSKPKGTRKSLSVN